MNVVILGSGRGSNAAAILRAQADGKLGRARVVQIFSDRRDAGILDLGQKFRVPASFLDPGPFKTKFDDAGERRYVEAIQAAAPQLIVLAGFMRILRPSFIAPFAGRTEHYVTPEVDGGPIIDQVAVRIEELDTLESLESKIHAAEHELLPRVVARLSEGSLPAEPLQ